MQEEVTRKTIALAIKTAKLDGKALQAALRKFLQLYRKSRDAPRHGKQTLKQLNIAVNEHFTGIHGEAACSHLPHFLLDQHTFLCGYRNTQHNVSLSVCHLFTVLSVP